MITVIGSLKGGSGKSTVTFNLAIWLTMAECDVVVIDADPQATLSDALEVRREEGFQPMVERLGAKSMNDRDGLEARDDLGAVRTREEIIRDVWDENWWGSTKTLDVHVASVRKKIGAEKIETIRGVGFSLAAPDA